MSRRLAGRLELLRDTLRSLRAGVPQLALATIILLVALIASLVLSPSDEKTSAERAPGIDAPGVTAPFESRAPSLNQRSPGESAQISSSPSGPASSGSSRAPGPRVHPGRNAQGVTARKILVGAVYDRTAGTLNQAYGITGIGQIDQRAAIEHVRDYINSHGGIGGRKIEIVWYEYDQTSNKSPETVAQEACSTWTEDNHVFAVLAGYGGIDALNSCLTKAGVVEVNIGTGLSDARTYRSFPYLVDLDYPAIDRLVPFSIRELQSRGFYKRGRERAGYKLGIMSYDDPVFDRAIALARRELAKRGLKLSLVEQVHRAETPAAIADEIAQIRSAVLRFKSEDITHVQFLATTSSFEQSQFWSIADQQEYYPRYGLTSIDAAQALIATLNGSNGEGAATRVFKDALGVGWLPLSDQPRSDYSGNRESAQLRLCKRILSYEQWDDASRYKETVAGWTCDSFFYLKTAVEAAGRVVNLTTWVDAISNLKPPSAVTFDMSTTARRHDAMGAVRDFKFFENCECFHYTTGLKRV